MRVCSMSEGVGKARCREENESETFLSLLVMQRRNIRESTSPTTIMPLLFLRMIIIIVLMIMIITKNYI